jgi:hypothetical protein
LPLSLGDYLELVDWTGRQIVRGRGGHVPKHLPPILERVGIAADNWLPLVTGFGRLFRRVAGAPQTLARLVRPAPRCVPSARFDRLLSSGRGPRFRTGRAALLGPL